MENGAWFYGEWDTLAMNNMVGWLVGWLAGRPYLGACPLHVRTASAMLIVAATCLFIYQFLSRWLAVNLSSCRWTFLLSFCVSSFVGWKTFNRFFIGGSGSGCPPESTQNPENFADRFGTHDLYIYIFFSFIHSFFSTSQTRFSFAKAPSGPRPMALNLIYL